MQRNLLCRLFALLAYTSFLGMWSCTEQLEPDAAKLPNEPTQAATQSLKDAMYHEGTESWVVPQKDPYVLANFQQAYDNLSSGSSIQKLTRAQAEAFSGSERLQATHYALKIFPKDEHEQWKMELLEDVKIAYVPFDYVQLPDSVAKELMIPTRSEAYEFQDESRYTVTYDDLETMEGAVEPETYTMPVLYAVWPCGKPLPNGIDYVIDYEIFLPESAARTRSSSLSAEAMQMLENEAIDLALGSAACARAATRAGTVVTLTGKSVTTDTFLNDNVPLPNLKVRFKLGSNIWDTYTQTDGYFSITAPIPANASYSHVFQHPRWKITTENRTSPITNTWGTVAEIWGSNTHNSASFGSSAPKYEILHAINYYYNGSHSVHYWYYDEGIRIRAIGREDAKRNAYFTYSKSERAYITVFNNNISSSNYLIGTVLHELGHFTHYGERGGFDKFQAVHNLLAESFASYVGWHIGERYYSNLGYIKPYPSRNFTNQARQIWKKTDVGSDGWYSPLFVDLVDDYNQGAAAAGISFNSDMIKNFPHSIILTMAAESTTWSSVKTKLQQYVGVYYTSAELNSFLAPYDYWFSKNK